MVKIENLIIKNEKGVVLDVPNFEINKGDFVCIVGESGIGKSTLLNLIHGIVKPNQGEVKVDFNDIGYATQESNFLPYLTVQEHINISVDKDRKEIVYGLLEKFGIHDKLKSYFQKLSGGQKRICSLAIAIGRGKDLLLLDEPFNDLDKSRLEKVAEILNTLNNDGLTIVTTTHHHVEKLNNNKLYKIENCKIM